MINAAYGVFFSLAMLAGVAWLFFAWARILGALMPV